MAVKARKERGEIEEMVEIAPAVAAFRSRGTSDWVRFLPRLRGVWRGC